MNRDWIVPGWLQGVAVVLAYIGAAVFVFREQGRSWDYVLDWFTPYILLVVLVLAAIGLFSLLKNDRS